MDPSQNIRRETLRNPVTFATASATIQRRPNSGWIVIRSLPAGEDICPDVYRFTDEIAAERKYACIISQLQSKGYTVPT